MKILKFGGTSLQNADRITAAARIVAQAASDRTVCVVASAMGGVTNALLSASEQAASEGEFKATYGQIETRHLEALKALAEPAGYDALGERLQAILGELREQLQNVARAAECSLQSLDSILSIGERLSVELVAEALRCEGLAAKPCDTRQLIVTDRRFGTAAVEAEATYERLRAHLDGSEEVLVLTGFIASTDDGKTSTLGRGGSDLTASLAGAAVGAEVIEIWTDVDGVMSADPRLVPAARPIEHLSYEELMELSHFGAKVVYPPTIRPARNASIPLVIRNTMNPAFAGTRIDNERPHRPQAVCGISSINRVSLMRLEGDGMVGDPRIAARLFGALADEDIHIILISQASSQHSICFAVTPEAVDAARKQVDKEFAFELRAGLVDELVVEHDLSVLAAVGEGMRHTPGIAGTLCSVLGADGVNIHAIAQGSSELNISLVVERADKPRALEITHRCLFEGVEPASIVVAGTGGVGSPLLRQLEAAAAAGADLVVAGVANSRKMRIRDQGLAVGVADERPTRIDELVEWTCGLGGSRVFVDCTASDDIGDVYAPLLRAGVAVATANKKPLADKLEAWKTIRAASAGNADLYHEATVGAGLPVIRTLTDLLASGDRLLKIEGAFSGTLSYLMDRLKHGVTFSEAVRQAHAAGYTEPDPRDDLSGMDVARKLLILARVAGRPLEPGDVRVESLVTDPSLITGSLGEFWAGLESLDDHFAQRQEECARQDHSLCYLATLDDAGASVGLREISADHPCAGVRDRDNLFAFWTERYNDTPLVVQGPGAGPEVTAAGVLVDILRAVRNSGARMPGARPERKGALP
jgi:aspartokinase/homoserine dehydrogenase 1